MHHLISDRSLFVNGEAAEGGKEARGDVSCGVVRVCGTQGSNACNAGRGEGVLQRAQKCRNQHFVTSL